MKKRNTAKIGIMHVLTVLVLCLVLAIILPKASAELLSGTCGENVTWHLSDDGTLTISGTGAMRSYASGTNTPWSNYRSGIKNVVINIGVSSIGDCSFANCTSLTTVSVANSVTNIGGRAFSFCDRLTTMTLPSSLRTIGTKSFSDCDSLEIVDIPEGTISIGEQAFYACDSLMTVSVPASVTNIGDCAFSGCRSLTAINVSNKNTVYSALDGVLFNKNETELICYPAGKNAVMYEVPRGVITIADDAFAYNDFLSEVTISNGVTIIGSSAFFICHNLKTVNLSDSVKTICNSTFSGCTSLKTMTIPNSVTSIGYNAFSGCTGLTSVIISESMTSISNGMFSDCTSLMEVEIPDSVTMIGDGVFSGCRSLTSVTLPDNITTIGDSLFSGCDSLTTVTLPNGVKTIGWYAFYSCDRLINVYLPNSVMTINDYAFYSCASLLDVYYTGTEAEWNAIRRADSCFGGIDPAPTIHFNYVLTTYTLDALVLLDSSEQELDSIPAGNFYAEAQVKKQRDADPAVVILAAYTADGQFIDLIYVRATVPTGSSYAGGTWFDNSDGAIGEIRAFLVQSIGTMTPLDGSLSRK